MSHRFSCKSRSRHSARFYLFPRLDRFGSADLASSRRARSNTNLATTFRSRSRRWICTIFCRSSSTYTSKNGPTLHCLRVCTPNANCIYISSTIHLHTANQFLIANGLLTFSTSLFWFRFASSILLDSFRLLVSHFRRSRAHFVRTNHQLKFKFINLLKFLFIFFFFF